MTVPQVRLASYDFSHVEYTKTKDGKPKQKGRSIGDIMADFINGGGGDIPVIDRKGKDTTDLGQPIMPPIQ